MKEQSHKAEMATALRGDFARLRARGVATTLPTPPAVVAESPATPAGQLPEPSLGSLAQASLQGVQEPVDVAASASAAEAAPPEIARQRGAEEAVVPVPETVAEPRSATSWLDRLRGR